MLGLPLTLTSTTLFPVRLCQITRLDGVVLRIADAEESVTVDAQAWTSLPGCEIGAVKHILGGEVPSFLVKFAHSDGGTFDTFEVCAGLFDGAAIDLYIADRANLAAGKGLLFRGTIQPVSIHTLGGGSFDCRGQAAQAETVIQTFQPMCRTDLFSILCGLDETLFDHTGTVGTIIDQFNITVAGLASPPADGWFNQGIGVTASGIKFEISNWVLSTLTLTTFLPRCSLFTASEGLTLFPGCDKTMSATGCGKFSNWINFQGEPHYAGAAAAAVGTGAAPATQNQLA